MGVQRRKSALTAPIMILNWNGWDDTLHCLQSLADAPDASVVWLVDNASDDDRFGEAETVFPGLRLIRLDANYGWSGGYNRALRLAAEEGWEYAYLLNNDCTVSPGFLLRALEAARSDESLAAIGSVIYFSQSSGYVRFDGAYHGPGQCKFEPFKGHRPVAEVNGAGMLVRVKALERDGLFDERFFCYSEETEWCMRMTRSGWGLGLAGESFVHHSGQGSNTDANTLYYRLRNSFLLQQLAATGATWRDLVAFGYICLRVANRSRRIGDIPTSLAATQAFRDAARGRFGKRTPPSPDLIYELFSRAWPVPEGSRTRATTLAQRVKRVRRWQEQNPRQ